MIAARRLGLEQEFFLVDEEGVPSERADEFLQRCREVAEAAGGGSEYFAPEWVKGMIEINTPPAHTATELAREYLKNLKVALQVGRELSLRLYPLSSYPLHLMPAIRDKLNYHVQVRTVGYDRFLHAGKCTGTHLHLEVAPGVIDSRVGVSYNSTQADREELLNIYNLATALDSALVALGRACPFYEGQALGLANHAVRYRGSDTFGWEGVYTHLQPVGGLMPYADSVESLVELQFERYYAWLEAMDKACVSRHLFFEAEGSLLETGWNPVRLNDLGTVELRNIDSNYPQVILMAIALVSQVANRVRRENLTVSPSEQVQTFELSGDRLFVPAFEYLNGGLIYAAATEGVKSPEIKAYLDSILKFAVQDDGEGTDYLSWLKSNLGEYQTTEAKILQEFAPTGAQLSQEEGLRLVRQSCNQLEEQVASLSLHPLEGLEAKT